MNKRTSLSITGATSLMLGVGAGTSGLTLSCIGETSPGLGMMIACALLMYVAQEAFGRMRADVSWKIEHDSK